MKNEEILGIFLHFGHIFSGYKDKEIADYAKGFVMGITSALELAGKIDSHNILPEKAFDDKKAMFGIEQFFRGFYYAKLYDRTEMQAWIDAINNLDISGLMKKAEKRIIKVINSNRPFFVDPDNKIKQ